MTVSLLSEAWVLEEKEYVGRAWVQGLDATQLVGSWKQGIQSLGTLISQLA